MELENVEGVSGKLKVWIRRVWTLEMVRISADSYSTFTMETFPMRVGLMSRFPTRVKITFGTRRHDSVFEAENGHEDQCGRAPKRLKITMSKTMAKTKATNDQ